eukprot:COSAG01_NODE_3557_length_5939_cov_4.468151_8_plen_162_part_00
MRAEQASEAAKEGEALLARVETAIRTDGVSAQLASCHVAIFAFYVWTRRGVGVWCLRRCALRAEMAQSPIASRHMPGADLGCGGPAPAPHQRAVSRAFPSWKLSILTEIYLCHACSYRKKLRMETPEQAAAVQGLGRLRGAKLRHAPRQPEPDPAGLAAAE